MAVQGRTRADISRLLASDETSRAVHAVLVQFQPHLPNFRAMSKGEVMGTLRELARRLRLVDRIHTRLVLTSDRTDVTAEGGSQQVCASHMSHENILLAWAGNVQGMLKHLLTNCQTDNQIMMEAVGSTWDLQHPYPTFIVACGRPMIIIRVLSCHLTPMQSAYSGRPKSFVLCSPSSSMIGRRTVCA